MMHSVVIAGSVFPGSHRDILYVYAPGYAYANDVLTGNRSYKTSSIDSYISLYTSAISSFCLLLPFSSLSIFRPITTLSRS